MNRLKDQNDHFPYKLDDAMEIITTNPPMGRKGPDDASLTGLDFITEEIADTSDAYISAQAEYLKNPNRQTLAVYRAAKNDLLKARLRHRADR